MALEDIGVRAAIDNLGGYLGGFDDMNRAVDKHVTSLDKSEKSHSAFSGVLKAGALGLAGAATALLGFAGVSVFASSDMAESQNKVNVVFSESAGVINEFATNAAKNIGLSRQAALDAAGGFGNMFTQLGIGTTVASKMSTEMLTLAADFASFHNADITEVIAAQTSAFRGEFDAVQRFVPTINAAAVEQKALELTGKATTKALTDQEKALAVNALLMAGAGKAAGDFANTSTGMANSLRIIKATAADATAQLGERLLPIITPLISQFASALPKALDVAIAAFDKIGGVVGPAIDTFQLFVQGVREMFDDTVEFTDGLQQAFERVFGPGSPMIEGAINVVAAFKNFVDGIRALIEGDFTGAMGQFQVAGQQAFSFLTTVIQEIVAFVLARLPDWIGTLQEFGKAFVQWVIDAAPPLLNELLTVVQGILAFIQANAGPLLDQLGQWALAFVEWVLPLIPPLLQSLGQVLNRILDFIIANGPTLAERFLSEWVPAAVVWVAKVAIEIVKHLPSILFEIGKWIVTEGIPRVAELFVSLGEAIISGIIRGIANLAGQLFGALADMARQAFNSAMTAVRGGSPSRLFMEVGASISEGMALGISQNSDLVQKALNGLGGLNGPVFAGSTAGLARMPLGVGGAGTTNSTVNYNVTANYSNPQEPQGIRQDLESIALMAGR